MRVMFECYVCAVCACVCAYWFPMINITFGIGFCKWWHSNIIFLLLLKQKWLNRISYQQLRRHTHNKYNLLLLFNLSVNLFSGHGPVQRTHNVWKVLFFHYYNFYLKIKCKMIDFNLTNSRTVKFSFASNSEKKARKTWIIQRNFILLNIYFLKW